MEKDTAWKEYPAPDNASASFYFSSHIQHEKNTLGIQFSLLAFKEERPDVFIHTITLSAEHKLFHLNARSRNNYSIALLCCKVMQDNVIQQADE